MGLHKPNHELSTLQKRLLQLYKSHLDTYGSPPTVAWLARELDVFPYAVRYHLQKFEERGLLKPVERKITVMRLSAKGRKAAL